MTTVAHTLSVCTLLWGCEQEPKLGKHQFEYEYYLENKKMISTITWLLRLIKKNVLIS